MKSIKFKSIAAAAVLLSTAACNDNNFSDITSGDPEDGTIEVALNLRTVTPTVVGKPFVNDISRAEGDDTGGDESDDDLTAGTAKEESVKDIWVLQFGADGKALVAPRYYTVTSDVVENLNIRLAEAEGCHLYVVANTGDTEWVKDKDFSTLEKFRAYEMPFTGDDIIRDTDNEYIPMIGDVPDLDIHRQSDLRPVDIYLTRMLSKISFKYTTNSSSENLVVNRIIINNLPTGIRMEHNDEASEYPTGDFKTQSYTFSTNLKSGNVYTFYMPENRQGTNNNTEAGTKNDGAPDKALYVQLFISSNSNGSSFLYTIYPGTNDVNDFNVRRNHNYNITLNLVSEDRDNRVLAAPANCFVLGYNEEIMFDPYNRTENGGGWSYSDFVNKNDPAKTIKSVKILWQTEGTIGDNSDFKKVYMDDYNRIHVNSGGKAGNAVIAGYNGDNGTGDIVWSWHIWVNNEKPARLSAAIPYTTYAWNASGIQTNQPRVKGRSVMSCNLGARSASPGSDYRMTYGTLYQWGRKDPFPHPWAQAANYSPEFSYTASTVGKLYDNSYKEIPMKSDGYTDTNELFGSKLTNAQYGNLDYVIKHPTVFLRTLKTAAQSEEASAYENDGDWFWGHEDRLWGGKPESEATMKYKVPITPGAGGQSYLANNGAEEKSIFDPCPAGWMLAPAEMWLGFTKTGINSTDPKQLNCKDNDATQNGYHMYLNGWKTDPGAVTSYFPSQGLRLCNGKAQRTGICGNYETSSPAAGGKVNIFHLHCANNIATFEAGYQYTRRGVAGPVRCMRDSYD